MGSWRKVGAFFGLSPDETHQYEADEYDNPGYEGGYDGGYERAGAGPEVRGYEAAGYARSKRGATDRGRDLDEYRPAERAPEGYPVGGYRSGAEGSTPLAAGASGRSPRRSFTDEPVTQGALAMQADQRRDVESSTAARPASVKLTGFGEARIVGEKYRDGQSVILDMTDMSDGDARRLVDFSAGLAFSLRGSIEKVAPKVFMLLPAEADIAGGAANALEDARAYVGAYAHR
jgi:cell division inhibitor SepF